MLSSYSALRCRGRYDGMAMLMSRFSQSIEDLLWCIELPGFRGFPYGFITKTEFTAEIAAALRSTGRSAIEPQRPSQLDVLPTRPVDSHFFRGRRESDRIITSTSHSTFRKEQDSAYP